MTKNIFYLLCLVTALLYTSCKSRKEMVYLNNTTHQETITIDAPLIDNYKLKCNDNLYVDIQSLNNEVNALFNPTKAQGASGGTTQNYGSPNSQLLNGFTIDLRGEITLPIIGKVKVENLTLDECNSAIQAKADEYLKDAIVKVKLLSFKVTVMGEVKNPGIYYNYNSVFTLLDAVSMARGETDYSQIKKVRVIRATETGNKIYQLDLTSKDFMTSEAFHLLPNDVVYVQPDSNKSLKINMPVFTLAMSTISTLILMINFVSNN